MQLKSLNSKIEKQPNLMSTITADSGLLREPAPVPANTVELAW